MAKHADVVQGFSELAEALTTLADAIRDDLDAEAAAIGAADQAGSAAESFDRDFPKPETPGADRALTLARAATAAVGRVTARPLDKPALSGALAASEAACAALPAKAASRPRLGLIGALRVAPTTFRAAPQRKAGLGLAGADGTTKDADAETPPDRSYVASLVLLFPTEAVTLFPLGRSIADEDAGLLLLVIVAVGLFVTAVRYLGTLDPATRKPVWPEIWIALFSYLLWIGSVNGYDAGANGWLPMWPTPAKNRGLFGFLIIIWVALVPYYRVAIPAKAPK